MNRKWIKLIATWNYIILRITVQKLYAPLLLSHIPKQKICISQLMTSQSDVLSTNHEDYFILIYPNTVWGLWQFTLKCNTHDISVWFDVFVLGLNGLTVKVHGISFCKILRNIIFFKKKEFIYLQNSIQ